MRWWGEVHTSQYRTPVAYTGCGPVVTGMFSSCRQTPAQHVLVFENASLKPSRKKVMGLIEQPTHWEVICLVGQKGGEGKPFLQNCINYVLQQ